MKRTSLGVLGLALVWLSSASLAAQGRGKPRVIQLEEIRIEGRVQKPNAFYILNRSSLGYELERSKRSFVDELYRSAYRPPLDEAPRYSAKP